MRALLCKGMAVVRQHTRLQPPSGPPPRQRWDASSGEIENGIFLGRILQLTFKGPYGFEGVSCYRGWAALQQQWCASAAAPPAVDAAAAAPRPAPHRAVGQLHCTLDAPQKILAFDFDTLTLRLGPITWAIPLKAALPRAPGSYKRMKSSPFFRRGTISTSRSVGPHHPSPSHALLATLPGCSFFYIDERVAAARGRGGGIAVWARTSPAWELEKGIV